MGGETSLSIPSQKPIPKYWGPKRPPKAGGFCCAQIGGVAWRSCSVTELLVVSCRLGAAWRESGQGMGCAWYHGIIGLVHWVLQGEERIGELSLLYKGVLKVLGKIKAPSLARWKLWGQRTSHFFSKLCTGSCSCLIRGVFLWLMLSRLDTRSSF